MSLEERVNAAEKFLDGIKENVFTDKRFSRVYTDIGSLKDEIEDIIIDLKTKSEVYLMAKRRANRYTSNIIYQSQFEAARRDLQSVLWAYEELSSSKILPTLKQKLVDLPDRIKELKMQIDPIAPVGQTIEEPPPELKVKPEFIVPVEPSGDERVDAFKEKINRALEWIEIPLKIGKGVEKFLSEYGSTIVSAVSGVLKMLAFL